MTILANFFTSLLLFFASSFPAHLAMGSLGFTRMLAAQDQGTVEHDGEVARQEAGKADAAQNDGSATGDDPDGFRDDGASETELDPAVDALLTAVETATDDMRVFKSRISHTKRHAILGDETRTGNIIYKLDAAPLEDERLPGKRFGIHFDGRLVGSRLTKQNELYVFDGRWLAEINFVRKQYISREIVAPGESLDPLALGQGPFPLPVGQPRAQVLLRFSVTPAQLPTEGPLKNVAKGGPVDGVILTPREGTREAQDFKTVTVFYDRASRLPVGIHAVHEGGNEDFVLLRDPQINPELTEADFTALTATPPTDAGWLIDER